MTMRKDGAGGFCGGGGAALVAMATLATEASAAASTVPAAPAVLTYANAAAPHTLATGAVLVWAPLLLLLAGCILALLCTIALDRRAARGARQRQATAHDDVDAVRRRLPHRPRTTRRPATQRKLARSTRWAAVVAPAH